jgi:hypothetical protein
MFILSPFSACMKSASSACSLYPTGSVGVGVNVGVTEGVGVTVSVGVTEGVGVTVDVGVTDGDGATVL